MRSCVRPFAAALLFLPFAGISPVVAQEAVTGVVSGTVVVAGTDAPIEGAQVVLLGTDRRAVTDARGRFVIGAVPPGIWRVQVRAIGYLPVVVT
jgi:hypothetical protein